MHGDIDNGDTIFIEIREIPRHFTEWEWYKFAFEITIGAGEERTISDVGEWGISSWETDLNDFVALRWVYRTFFTRSTTAAPFPVE